MSELSGSLADFTLSAVIRLLSAGDKTGILVINAPTIGGSIFFDAGELAFATTRKYHQIGNAPTDDRREGPPETGDDMIADVITRLTRHGSGSFTFQADVQPVHDITTTFSADHILGLVDSRLEVWRDVLDQLGSTDEAFTMASGLGVEEKITLSGFDWNVLSELRDGMSSSNVASALRIGELESAQALVRLKADGLVEPVETPTPVAAPRSFNGDRLIEPDPDDVVINITDAAIAAMDEETDDLDGAEAEDAPVGDLAARWRDLRGRPRDEIPST